MSNEKIVSMAERQRAAPSRQHAIACGCRVTDEPAITHQNIRGAAPEDVDFRIKRRLDIALFQQLLSGRSVDD